VHSKRWLRIPIAVLVLAIAADAAASPSPKKGVGMSAFNGDTEALAEIGASWFYTWSTGAGGIVAPAGVAFVPMIWGSGSVTTANLNTVKTEGGVLLGFNEPDNAGQSNMTPQQALALWPQLVATGMRLGSPAVAANAQAAGGWLDTFMSGAAQQGLRVDFICLHWYGGNFNPTSAVSELQTYLAQTNAKYNLPIWLTEYALTNYGVSPATYPTDAQQVAFAAASVAMLESTSYVERYAWFELPPCNNCAAGDNKALATDGGGLTAVGVAYAGEPDAGQPVADGGLPADAAQNTAPTDGSPDAPLGAPATDGATAAGSGEGTMSSDGATGADEDRAVQGGASSSGGCQCQSSGRPGGSSSSGAFVAMLALWLWRGRSRKATLSNTRDQHLESK
jgi:putative glycosyl hydrolase